MNPFFSKVMRFIMNFLFYAVILISTTYYVYTNIPDPEIIALKNVLFPMQAAMLLAFILSLIMAIVNEITTIFIIRIARRKQP